MQRHVDSYEDEWAATLKDERRLRRFRAFINEPNGSDEASHLLDVYKRQG